MRKTIWLQIFILFALAGQHFSFAEKDPDPMALLRSPNPYTVLGIDPLTANEIDLDSNYEFWTRIFANSQPEDNNSWIEIETAYRNLKDPKFVEAYFDIRKNISKQSDSFLFSVGPQDLARFFKLRITEIKRGLYKRENLIQLSYITRQLYEAFQRDLVGAPTAVLNAGILEFFQARVLDFNRVYLSELEKLAVDSRDFMNLLNRTRLPYLASPHLKILIADEISKKDLRTLADVLSIRTKALALNRGQPDSIVDEALGDILTAFKTQDSFKYFLASLNSSELKTIHYFAPELSEKFCLESLKNLFVLVN